MGQHAPVAGYDLTFSVPKSVSLMWVLGDQATRAGIEDVMGKALGEVISWAEDHVFFTRTGAQGARQESVRGVVASTRLHFESRDGDAQLHHHTVVWNRAQTVSDGVWRTLDGKALHPLVVAPSERHVGLVEDLMTARFGVSWRETRAIAGRVARREVDVVAPDLVAEFSRRTLAIEAVIATKAAELEAARRRVTDQRRARCRLPGGMCACLVDKVVPGWNPSCDEVANYNDEDIARWFAGAARRQGLRPQSRVAWPEPHRGVFGKVKLKGGQVVLRDGPEVGAWKVRSTLVRWNAENFAPPSALIAEDGQLFIGFVWIFDRRNPSLEVAGRFRVAALIHLARSLGFPTRR
jgi:conjugative relaxase-like TrwC/TraI family protein